MNRDKLWERFMWLLSLDLHDGDEKDAKERPTKNFHGAASAYRRHFNQAWDDMNKMYEEQRKIPAWAREPDAEDPETDVDFDRTFGDIGGEG